MDPDGPITERRAGAELLYWTKPASITADEAQGSSGERWLAAAQRCEEISAMPLNRVSKCLSFNEVSRCFYLLQVQRTTACFQLLIKYKASKLKRANAEFCALNSNL